LFSATLIITIFVAIINYNIDPFFIHQWDAEILNRLSPAKQKITPWAKTYAAYKYQPDVIYLGSSRSEVGLPIDNQLFHDKRILNLALPGGTPDDAIDMLSHACFFHSPEIVVWGIEYGWLFDAEGGNTDLDQALLAKNSFYPAWRFLLNLRRSFSMEITSESIKIILGKSENTCLPIMATFGHLSDRCMHKIMYDEGGAASAFDKALRNEKSPPTPSFNEQMDHLREGISSFCDKGISLRLFIQPNHALSELRFIKEWNIREEWLMELVKSINVDKNNGCDIKLYDFSGFNPITTENIPQITGNNTMEYYWEQSHYKTNVGQFILNKIFLNENVSDQCDFGVELTGSNIENHIENVRILKAVYINSHSYELKNF
jgi:hypothetical protein